MASPSAAWTASTNRSWSIGGTLLRELRSDPLDRALRAHGRGPEDVLEGVHPEVGLHGAAARQPVELPLGDHEAVVVGAGGEDRVPLLHRRLPRQQRHLELALRARDELEVERVEVGDRADLAGAADERRHRVAERLLQALLDLGDELALDPSRGLEDDVAACP